MDSMLVNQSAEELRRYYINKGFVNAEVTATLDTTRRKKATVTYAITENEPYRIQPYRMYIDDAKIDSIARLQPPKRTWYSSAFRTYSSH